MYMYTNLQYFFVRYEDVIHSKHVDAKVSSNIH